ncbi:MAG: BFD-like (2Fe-2S) protein [Nitrospirae bacterium]|nr:BFD-like (2Fe-2S) protein [Nitrospirota bacterium]
MHRRGNTTQENLICYCFGYTEEDIVKDVMENRGASSILERILSEKKKGTCRCGTTHPLGR